jgi:PAS domain S-box-containing protein
MIYLDLIFNLALLIALSVISVFIEQRWPKQTRAGVLLQGVLFGTATVIGMLRPVDLGNGLIFDGRSVLLSLCALFFGPWAASAAGAMAIVCRIALGGAGMRMGTLVILASVGIGLCLFYRLKNREFLPSTRFLYLFGLAVHLVMVALMFSLPAELVATTIKRIGLPVIMLYPLATILAGKILSDQRLALSSLARLQRTKQNLDITLQSIGDGVISTDLQGAVVLMNTVAERLTGWPREEARGRPLDDIYKLVDAGSGEPVDRGRYLAGDRPGGLADAMILVARDGSQHRITDSLSPICDVKGGTLGQVVVFRDVGQAYRMLQALRESEEDYRKLFEDHAAVKLIVEPRSGNIVDANHAAAAYYGWPRETLRRMNIRQINQDAPDQIMLAMHEAASLKQFKFEFRHLRADGSIRDVEVYSSRVRIKGGNYLHSIIYDITERKQSEDHNRKLQEQLTQAQKMESVGRLAGGVAHDFNNMLSLIIGHSELALAEVDANQPIHAELTQILAAAHRSADLTRQLLAFARRQAINPKVLDLNETMAGMLKMLQRLIGEDIELVWKPGANLDLVKIDPVQVDQILANLAVNARDAIAGVGHLTIETENVALDEAYCKAHAGCLPGDYVLLAISDTGSGMSKEVIDHLFEPFFTTKDLGRGTGLGLATVYGIVRQNNGLITVYSEPGKGTTFKIYLPREQAAEASAASPDEAEPPSGTETILVVEDEEPILELAATILTRFGYAVLKARTPDAAIALAQCHTGRIDLLLTDVVMPGMNGGELTERVARLRPGLKTIFMSGYPTAAVASYGVEMKKSHYLPKPFSIRSMALKVRQVLDS